MELFSNNAEAVIATPIAGLDETLTLPSPFSDFGFEYVDPVSGDFQRATLTHTGLPGQREIVQIVGTDGASLTVKRAQEGTTARAWPPNAKLSANVTAAMLMSFLGGREPGNDREFETPNKSFVVNGRAFGGTDVVQVSGFPVLQPITARPVQSGGGFITQDSNLSHEVMGGAPQVNLGDVPTWESNHTYTAWSIVKPTTPNGYHYYFEPRFNGASTVSTTEPAFDGYPVAALSISAPLIRMPRSLAAKAGTRLREVAAAISVQFGSHPATAAR